MSETGVISRSAGTVSVRRARLRVSRGPNKGRELELGGLQPALLGSHPDADLQLEDDTVSRNHAEVRATPLGYVIRDLGSTNGVWIGELRVLEAVLGERAKKLSLGNVELEFKLLDDEVAHAQSTRPFGRLLGQSAPMRELASLLEQAAGSDS